MFDQSKFKSNVVANTANLVYDDSEAFKANSPVPVKVAKEYESYKKSYIENAAHIAEEQAIKLLKKDSNLERVIVQFPFTTSGNGMINVKIDRSRKYHVPSTDGKSTEVFMPAVEVGVKDTSSKLAKSKVKAIKQRIDAALSK